jgi:general stress protein YciG
VYVRGSPVPHRGGASKDLHGVRPTRVSAHDRRAFATSTVHRYPAFLYIIPTDPAVAPGLHCSDSTVKIENKGVYVAKEDRGFASMDRMRQREIASKGGKAAHQKGTAHEWTSEEARNAGRKGGLASHRQRRERKDSGDTRELVGAVSGFSTEGAE